MEKLAVVCVVIKAFADAADDCAQQARAQAATANGAARRLWLEEERVERARAEAFRMALHEITEIYDAPALARVS